MELNWELTMQDLLHANLKKYLKNNIASELLNNEYCPNILIKSQSPVVTCAYINYLVCSLANKPISNLFNTLTYDNDNDYYHNNFYFVFNVNYNSINIIKNIASQKCITMPRHIIVLNIVEKVSRYSLSIRSIINRYLSTTTFIIVNNFDHYITKTIYDLLLVVNLNFDIKLFCQDAGVHDSFIKNNDPMDICIKMSNLDINLSDSNNLEIFLLKQLDALYISQSNQGIRNLVIKLGAACVPITTLANIILKWKANAYTIELLCEMDHIIKQNSKELFAMENFFQQLLKKTDL